MLEPAVRPGATSTQHNQQTGRAAFENSSFHELLAEAGRGGQGGSAQDQSPGQADQALNVLSGLSRIENAGLRHVLAQVGKAGGA